MRGFSIKFFVYLCGVSKHSYAMAQLRFFDYEAAYRYYCGCIDGMRRGSVRGTGVKRIAKPMLILAVIKGVGDGMFTVNRFEYDELEGIYTALFRQHFVEARQDSLTPLANPFYYLQSDAFWHLSWLPHATTRSDGPSAAWVRRNCDHAYLDSELWLLLQQRDYRQRLAAYILDTQVRAAATRTGMAAEGGTLLTLLALLAAI